MLKFSDPVHAVAQHGDSSLAATVGRRLVCFEPPLLQQQGRQQTWSPRSLVPGRAGGARAGEDEAEDEEPSSSCSMLPSAMTVLKVNPSGQQQLIWCAALCSSCAATWPSGWLRHAAAAAWACEKIPIPSPDRGYAPAAACCPVP